MKADDLEELEAGQQLQVQAQYEAALGGYRYQVRILDDLAGLFLANKVQVEAIKAGEAVYFEVTLTDAWVWAVHRQVRTVSRVLIQTFATVITEDMKQP